MPTADLRILAAGSLRGFLTEHAVAEAGACELVFGPAGLLRERIEAGEAAFAASLLAERGQARLAAHGFERKGATSQ